MKKKNKRIKIKKLKNDAKNESLKKNKNEK